MALQIKINRPIINIIRDRWLITSKAAPIANEYAAMIRNFPFKLISGSSDLSEILPIIVPETMIKRINDMWKTVTIGV